MSVISGATMQIYRCSGERIRLTLCTYKGEKEIKSKDIGPLLLRLAPIPFPFPSIMITLITVFILCYKPLITFVPLVAFTAFLPILKKTGLYLDIQLINESINPD